MSNEDSMKITGFGIANYRSFHEEGSFVKDIGKVNIFIGKNNSGKSNILRFLQFVASGAASSPNQPAIDKNRNTTQPIRLGLSVSIGKVFDSSHLIDPGMVLPKSLDVWVEFPQKNACGKHPLEPFTDRWIEKYHEELTKSHYRGSVSRKQLFDDTLVPFAKKAMYEFQQMTSKLIYIPAIREIRATKDKENTNIIDFSGCDLGEKLKFMQHSEIGKESEKERFHRIEDKIRELLCVDKLEMEILPNNDIILTINGPTGSRLPLEHHGTGIHELVIICSTLMLYENHIVCIEEPEIHLHPELLRRFYRFLATTNNIYFIATHSNVLLDADETSVVYHVSHDGLSSKITRSYTNDNTRGILRDLGYRASDLLQTNGIIWVEGPSDRIYINKWLALYGCTTLIEGVDYSIMFYGGACLANLSASDCIPSEDFIELLRINSNAIVVIDRDGESADSVLKEYKRRIQSEIGEDNCWITQGREIENYLTPNLLNRYLGSRYPDKSISVEFGIDDKISKCIKTAVGEESFDYAHSKRNYAKEICEMMNSEDLEQLDLKKRIKQICDAITEWNKD